VDACRRGTGRTRGREGENVRDSGASRIAIVIAAPPRTNSCVAPARARDLRPLFRAPRRAEGAAATGHLPRARKAWRSSVGAVTVVSLSVVAACVRRPAGASARANRCRDENGETDRRDGVRHAWERCRVTHVMAETLHAQARLRARRLSYARPRLAECAYERRGQRQYGATRIVHGIRRRASSGPGVVRARSTCSVIIALGRHVGGEREMRAR
jgi:hypothetical protein